MYALNNDVFIESIVMSILNIDAKVTETTSHSLQYCRIISNISIGRNFYVSDKTCIYLCCLWIAITVDWADNNSWFVLTGIINNLTNKRGQAVVCHARTSILFPGGLIILIPLITKKRKAHIVQSGFLVVSEYLFSTFIFFDAAYYFCVQQRLPALVVYIMSLYSNFFVLSSVF